MPPEPGQLPPPPPGLLPPHGHTHGSLAGAQCSNASRLSNPLPLPGTVSPVAPPACESMLSGTFLAERVCTEQNLMCRVAVQSVDMPRYHAWVVRLRQSAKAPTSPWRSGAAEGVYLLKICEEGGLCGAEGRGRQGWAWNWRAKERRARTRRQLVGVSSQLCIVEVPRVVPPTAERVRRRPEGPYHPCL